VNGEFGLRIENA